MAHVGAYGLNLGFNGCPDCCSCKPAWPLLTMVPYFPRFRVLRAMQEGPKT